MKEALAAEELFFAFISRSDDFDTIHLGNDTDEWIYANDIVAGAFCS